MSVQVQPATFTMVSEVNLEEEKLPLEQDYEFYLDHVKKNCSPSQYQAFLSKMKETGREIKQASDNVRSLNRMAAEIEEAHINALMGLHKTVEEFLGQQVPYGKNLQRVLETRGGTRAAAEDMGLQFSRMNLQQAVSAPSVQLIGAKGKTTERTYSFPAEKELAKCMAEHPLIKDDNYLKEKDIVPYVAESFSGKTEVSEGAVQKQIVTDLTMNALPNPALAMTLEAAVVSCAKK